MMANGGQLIVPRRESFFERLLFGPQPTEILPFCETSWVHFGCWGLKCQDEKALVHHVMNLPPGLAVLGQAGLGS